MAEYIKSKKFIGVIYNELQNGDRSYYIFYKINGKTFRTHIGKKSEGITEAYCHQKRNDAINQAKFGNDDPIVKTKRQVITFDSIAQRYLEYNEIHSKDYTNHLSRYTNHIKPYLGEKSIFDISLDDILQIQKDKLKKLAPKTVNHIIQLINTIYNYNIKNKYIRAENPVSNIKKLQANNERLRYLDKEEIERLIETIKSDEQLLLFVKLALQTGGRANTIVNIQKKDIDLTNKIISLQDYKNNSFYRGFFGDDVFELLKNRVDKLKSNDYILLYHTAESNIQTYITKKLQPILNVLFITPLKNKLKNQLAYRTFGCLKKLATF